MKINKMFFKSCTRGNAESHLVYYFSQGQEERHISFDKLMFIREKISCGIWFTISEYL